MDRLTRIEILDIAFREATKELGVDPAYYGEEGEALVDEKIREMGYDPEGFKKNKEDLNV